MLSSNFRIARDRSGLRQAEAARTLGVAPETLYRIETGRQEAGRDLLVRMADLYGCSVDFLLGRAALPVESGKGRPVIVDEIQRIETAIDASFEARKGGKGR